MAFRLLKGNVRAEREAGREPAETDSLGAPAAHGRARAPEGGFGTPLDLNLIGLWTLYWKEVRRFSKVPAQTVVAPMVTTLLFLAVFAFALGGSGRRVGELAFLDFLAPGLVMMAVIQNAFANTSSSLVIAKVQGNIVDYIMPPLSPGEFLFGFAMGGVTRGLVVGAAVAVTVLPFAELRVQSVLLALYALAAASFALAVLGTIAGLWADKFDQLAAVTNFLITPLAFLAGTFYSVTQLPEAARPLLYLNPFFYMVDSFRYALTGHSDGAIWFGVLVLALVDVGLWLLALRLLRAGYKLKA